MKFIVTKPSIFKTLSHIQSIVNKKNTLPILSNILIEVGYNSLTQNTTGTFNTAVGKDAGEANTTGIKNVFVGQDAGYTTTSGTQNTFVGMTAYGSGATISNEIVTCLERFAKEKRKKQNQR